MAENGGFDWRDLLRRMVLPALVAVVVAGLMTLTILSVREPAESPYPAPDVEIAGVASAGTHFTGPVYSERGWVSTNNLTLTTGSLINTQGAVTVTDDLRVEGNVSAANATGLRLNDDVLITGTVGATGLVVAGNGINATAGITVLTGNVNVYDNVYSSAGSFRINDNVLITGTVGATSLVSAGNGLTAAGGVTVTSGDVSLATGGVICSQGAVTVSDNLSVVGNVGGDTGALDVAGSSALRGAVVVYDTISDGSTMLRLNDATLITGTLGVSSLVSAGNGLAAAGGITSTGMVTVTNWGLFYGLGVQPAVSQVVSESYGITPTAYSLMFLDDGGTGNQTSTLSATTSIVDGTYQGQLLVLTWTDAHGASLVVKDNANCLLSGDLTMTLGDSLVLVWNGSDWVELSYSNNS